MTDSWVLLSPDFYRRVTLRSLCIPKKYVSELLPGSKQLKISKLLLNVDKLKNFPQKKVYVHKLYNENYPFSFKKHMHIFFFNLRFHMTLRFISQSLLS